MIQPTLDEYDDVVLGHEYGHFVMQKYSVSDSPGGGHSSNDRVAPALAWGEGWATFFALCLPEADLLLPIPSRAGYGRLLQHRDPSCHASPWATQAMCWRGT